MNFEIAPFAKPADYGEQIAALAAIKEHCRVDADATYHDAELAFLRDAAISAIERAFGLFLGPISGLLVKADRIETTNHFGITPITAINAVSWVDSSGVSVAGDPAIWRIGLHGEIVLAPGAALPGDVAGFVEWDLDAGFASAELPSALVQAVKALTNYLFNRFEESGETTLRGEFPQGVLALIDPFRRIRI